eukprot:351775-Chlamydomonas_euryale.AAC.3
MSSAYVASSSVVSPSVLFGQVAPRQQHPPKCAIQAGRRDFSAAPIHRVQNTKLKELLVHRRMSKLVVTSPLIWLSRLQKSLPPRLSPTCHPSLPSSLPYSCLTAIVHAPHDSASLR